MTAPSTVPCSPGVRVTASGPVTHLCPYADETDHGTVTVAWITDGATLELHALAGVLHSYEDRRMSHEEFAADLRATLTATPGITGVAVAALFRTAGLDVEVSSAVPGDSIHSPGA